MDYSTTFIDAEKLFSIINDENLVILDCRFDLTKPEWGYQNYLETHIPNAIYADLDKDLSSPITPSSGRHPLPDQDKFIQKCSEWGIDHSKHVVVYDRTSGSFAARLWWLLRYFNHENVSILNGGLQSWVEKQYPIVNGSVSSTPSIFVGKIDENRLITTSQLEKMLNQDGVIIIDARAPERYHGITEPIDKKAGRIPGSINFFHQNNIGSDGNLLPRNILLEKYHKLLENNMDTTKILYCGSGVTSCLDVAVMEYLDIPDIKLYAGSWSEWIRNEDHPVINDSEH